MVALVTTSGGQDPKVRELVHSVTRKKDFKLCGWMLDEYLGI